MAAAGRTASQAARRAPPAPTPCLPHARSAAPAAPSAGAVLHPPAYLLQSPGPSPAAEGARPSHAAAPWPADAACAGGTASGRALRQAAQHGMQVARWVLQLACGCRSCALAARSAAHLAGGSHRARQLECQVAAAAAHIQHPVARLGARPSHCHALPHLVLAEAEALVELRREGGVHAIDRRHRDHDDDADAAPCRPPGGRQGCPLTSSYTGAMLLNSCCLLVASWPGWKKSRPGVLAALALVPLLLTAGVPVSPRNLRALPAPGAPRGPGVCDLRPCIAPRCQAPKQ